MLSFLLLNENIYCRYSSEALHRGTSNEYPRFRGEIRKILCGYPLLSVAMFSDVTASVYPDTVLFRAMVFNDLPFNAAAS